MLHFKNDRIKPLTKSNEVKLNTACDNSFFDNIFAIKETTEQLIFLGYTSIAYSRLNLYYKMCAPLGTAIDMIIDELAVSLFVKKVKTGEDVKHPVLELLKYPNTKEFYFDFIRSLGFDLILKGEVYILFKGNINFAPLEMEIIHPEQVVFDIDANNEISKIAVSYNASRQDFFYPKELSFFNSAAKTKIRYINRFNNLELYQIKFINPSPYAFRGCSKVNSVYYEIEQYINTCIHNLSLLKRGGRLSGILSFKDVGYPMTQETRAALREEIDNYYSGPDNAGRLAIFSSPLNYNQIGQTNKDMDFETLKNNVSVAIYNRLRIPLPKITADTMTLANKETAKLELYDNAVLPLLKHILNNLSNILFIRYNNPNLVLTYDIADIPALKSRVIEQAAAEANMQSVTINELRKTIGLQPLDNYDIILVNSTYIPLDAAIANGQNKGAQNDKAQNGKDSQDSKDKESQDSQDKESQDSQDKESQDSETQEKGDNESSKEEKRANKKK